MGCGRSCGGTEYVRPPEGTCHLSDGISQSPILSGMDRLEMEAPSGFEPEMEVLQTSALPLGDGADQTGQVNRASAFALALRRTTFSGLPTKTPQGVKVGAGNGIRTRDFDLGKVALYH